MLDGLFSRARSLWRALRPGAAIREDMDEEFRFHLELRTSDLMRTGLSPADAERRALIEFGSRERYKEEGRESRGLAFFDQARGDLRYAARALRRNPVFTTVAVITLALGIGANGAIFSVIHHTLLRPLPYGAPDRIVTLLERDGSGRGTVAEENFRDWQAAARSFEAMAYHWNPDFGGPETVLGANEAVRVWVNGGSEDFFAVFGARAVTGRLFTVEEQRVGGPPVAVISDGFWRTHMGADPAVLGRTLDMLGGQFVIVGVLSPGFHYPRDTDIWVPLLRWEGTRHRTAKNNLAVGRLRAGLTAAQAQRELDQIGAAMIEQLGESSGAAGAVVTPLREELVGNLRQPLLLLLGAAGLLLLIACTNLASTLLARGAMRSREVAIRSALGANRGRIVRQLVTESLVLALLGAVSGMLLAMLLLRVLEAMRPAGLETLAGAAINGPVLGFSLALTIVTALLFGLLPALRTSIGETASALRAGARGNAAAGGGRGWNVLVGVEVALAVVLVVGAGLLIRSFAGVIGQDPGFDPSHVLTAEVSLPPSRYPDDAALARFYERALSELRSIPGVEQAGLIQHIPLGGARWNGSFDIEARGEADAHADYRIASPGYFAAMDIAVLRGREFAPTDHAGAPHVAIINRTLAERVWPGEDPIGQRVGNLANEPTRYRVDGAWLTIVGVVDDVRQTGLLTRPQPEIYVNVLQRPARARQAVLALRVRGKPRSLIAAARERMRIIDTQVPVEFATMTQRVMASVADRRFNMVVLGLFAAVALGLAAVGIYGVVSYSVARRTREIGIRLALGATPASVRRLMQRATMLIVLAGGIIGAAGAVSASQLIRGLLWGVEAGDPITFAAAGGVLLAVAWLATYIPARRSTRVDPLVTMQAE